MITKDDRVYSFGDQSNKQNMLGLGQNRNGESVARPTEIVELRNQKIVKFVSGSTHMLALSIDGKLWSWGSNSNGQLGVGNLNDCNRPVLVEKAINVIDVSSSSYTSYALTQSGHILAWGENKYGECGINTTNSPQSFPVQVAELNNVVKVQANFVATTIALTNDSKLYIWGLGFKPIPTLLTFPLIPTSVTSTCFSFYMLTNEGYIYRTNLENTNKIEAFYNNSTRFKSIYADLYSCGDLDGYIGYVFTESIDGQITAWSDADVDIMKPWSPNAKNIAQAFAIEHEYSFLPFMIKLEA